MAEKTERRKHPRVKDENVGVQFSGEGINTITQSLDISASGIYCKVDRHMPVMTRVQLVLSLPGEKNSSSRKLEIEGVVVREHPVKRDGRVMHYDVAIFFNCLMPKEREMLARYIENRAG